MSGFVPSTWGSGHVPGRLLWESLLLQWAVAGVLGSWQKNKVLKAVNTLEMNCVQTKNNKMVHFRRT